MQDKAEEWRYLKHARPPNTTKQSRPIILHVLAASVLKEDLRFANEGGTVHAIKVFGDLFHWYQIPVSAVQSSTDAVSEYGYHGTVIFAVVPARHLT